MYLETAPRVVRSRSHYNGDPPMMRYRQHFLVIPAALSLLVIAACSGGDGSTGGNVVARDSSGVQILVSEDSGSWKDSNRPTLTEVTRIGNVAADTNYQLGMVTAVDIGSDGTIFVLDATSGNIRAFNESGKHLRTLSRRGTGPGEISRFAAAMIVTPGDTILVVDPARQTVTSFTTDGRPAGDVSMPLTDGIPVKWWKRDDGSIVVQVRQLSGALGAMMAQGRGGTVTAADTAAKPDQLQLRNSSGKVIDTLLALPVGQTLGSGGALGLKMRLFAPEPMWTTGGEKGDNVYFGMNNEYSINEYDNTGTLRRIIRRNVERAAVTEQDKTNILKAITEQISKMGGAAATAMPDMSQMIEFAEYFPALGNLMGGPDGTLWVQRAISPAEAQDALNLMDPSRSSMGSSTWDVYDKSGALLGSIVMPDKFTPMRWSRDKLVGVQIDSTEVPNVVVYSLGAGRR